MSEISAEKLMALAQAEMLSREALADLVRFKTSKGQGAGQVHALVESAIDRLKRATEQFEKVAP